MFIYLVGLILGEAAGEGVFFSCGCMCGDGGDGGGERRWMIARYLNCLCYTTVL